jgi:hypothetical protein
LTPFSFNVYKAKNSLRFFPSVRATDAPGEDQTGEKATAVMNPHFYHCPSETVFIGA